MRIVTAERGNVNDLLAEIGCEISDGEVEYIRAIVYDIMRDFPKEKTSEEYTTGKECVSSIISAHQYGYFLYPWADCVLSNLGVNPSVLSRIVVENAQAFMSRGSRVAEKLTLEDFDDPEIIPPARLLASHLLKQPVDDELVRACLDYRTTAQDKLRKGTFEILYQVLNPF